MSEFVLKELPPDTDLETKDILKKLSEAHRYLAELKGISKTIPNESILVNTLTIQEAKDSSEIENIITTHDEVFKEELFKNLIENPAAKEVNNYARAIRRGFDLIKEYGLLTNNHIIEIHSILDNIRTGYRKQPGTTLKNLNTGEVVYTPPQAGERVLKLMDNLVMFINDDSLLDIDPLIKMAIIHYQFESVHPFYDGNGRTGRIINVLYLVLKKLLDLPVLYLSRYIIKNKDTYYSLLQDVRDNNNWGKWIVYILDGVKETSAESIRLINKIRDLMMDYKHSIRSEYSKMYSQDLLNNLFRHPYTKIEFIVKDLQVNRKTASKYLDDLVDGGFLHKEKVKNSNFYINTRLFDLLLGK